MQDELAQIDRSLVWDLLSRPKEKFILNIKWVLEINYITKELLS